MVTAMLPSALFESSVNSEYSKTRTAALSTWNLFESSVNSEYSKTEETEGTMRISCLRVV